LELEKGVLELERRGALTSGGVARPAVATQSPAQPRKPSAVARHMWSEASIMRPS